MAKPKAADRLAAIRERVARQSTPTPPDGSVPAVEADPAQIAAASAHFIGALEQLTHGRAVTALDVEAIGPDLRPDQRQPRLLPLPSELVVQGQPVAEYQPMIAELRELGESLRQRQIQPIIVYPNQAPNATPRYVILVGHRRWTAACLVGLRTIDAIVVDPPTNRDRVLIQYAENEAREEFSDMERAWSIVQLQQALPNPRWEAVEQQLQLSSSRRQQLLRLLAFDEVQQRQIALLRLQETQARPLHTSLRQGELSPAQIDAILDRLQTLAATRQQRDDGQRGSRSGIDGPTIARLVAQARRAAQSRGTDAPPRWVGPLHQQLARTHQSLRRAAARLPELSREEAASLRADLDRLRADAAALAEQLAAQAEEPSA